VSGQLKLGPGRLVAPANGKKAPPADPPKGGQQNPTIAVGMREYLMRNDFRLDSSPEADVEPQATPSSRIGAFLRGPLQ